MSECVTKVAGRTIGRRLYRRPIRAGICGSSISSAHWIALPGQTGVSYDSFRWNGPLLNLDSGKSSALMTKAFRSRLLRSWSLALLVLAITACSSKSASKSILHSPEISSLQPAVSRRIDEITDDWIASGNAAGVAVEVSEGGRVVFARGFGERNLQRSLPVTPETQFRIGSVTKQFTAAAILHLVQEGKLSLSDKLADYYPNFPRANEVTIQELLTHTSGIQNYTEFGLKYWVLLDLRKDYTTDQWVDHIARQVPLYNFSPGTAWHYTNSGYYLLGAIIEKVSGESLANYLHATFFMPLGLQDTAIDANSDVGASRAAGYEQALWPKGTFKRPLYISMTVTGGAGAMRSSARDLIKWNDALLRGNVVTSALIQQMVAPAHLADGRLTSQGRFNTDPTDPGGEYGYAMRIDSLDGHREIGHEGDIFGFNAALYSYPDDRFTVVVLANTPGGAYELEKRIAKLTIASGHGSQ
jgi:D-alanyl-D-alanine carboxypeptidase